MKDLILLTLVLKFLYVCPTYQMQLRNGNLQMLEDPNLKVIERRLTHILKIKHSYMGSLYTLKKCRWACRSHKESPSSMMTVAHPRKIYLTYPN